MNNDLISRKYIQEQIPELDSYDNGCYVWLKKVEVEELIDNAPSVCGNNPKWCESCVSKGKCASTRPQDEITNDDIQQAIKEGFANGYEMAKEKIIHSIAKQYSEHNELVPIWLSIGDIKDGAK